MVKLSMIGNKADRVIGMTTAAFAATAGVGLVGEIPQASADIVWSGPVNIVIPDNIDGVYFNLVTGATGTSGATTPGWDINPYSASGTANASFNLWGPTAETWLNIGTLETPQYVIPEGTSIGPGDLFGRPGGSAVVPPQITLNAPNLFGVQFFFPEPGAGATTHYAWVEITFGAELGDRAITQYAYQSTPGTAILAGAIPEPSSLSVLALGALGLFARRRRVA